MSDVYEPSNFRKDMDGSEEYDPNFTLAKKCWIYRGEGNANLVLSLPEERKIVRFRKDYMTAEIDSAGEKERVWREAKFCRRVMAVLLGDSYVESPLIGYISPQEINYIDEMLRLQRPYSRHHKGLTLGHVLIYPDYAVLPPISSGQEFVHPTFCVEVKPKQGWLPITDRRFNKCTFCLNQFLKLKNGTIEAVSCYCPLDLFSGNLERMKYAVHSLLANPQNNLKVFRNGVLVFGDEMPGELDKVLRDWFPSDTNLDRAEDKLCDLVARALCLNLSTRQIYPFKPIPLTPWPPQPPPVIERLPRYVLDRAAPLLLSIPPCNWAHQPLPQGSILERILDIQHMECDGADKVFDDYLKLESREDFDYVDVIMNEESLNSIHRYLLATTAKDCSVMMCFRKVDQVTEPNIRILRDRDAANFEVSVGVSDLDPKPLSCIEKHRKRDHETLLACIHVLAGPNAKHCDTLLL